MSKPYRPSNGSEGDYFMAQWCYGCSRCRIDSDGETCDILDRSFWCGINDPDYPTEWIVDDDGLSNPRCTAFEPLAIPTQGKES